MSSTLQAEFRKDAPIMGVLLAVNRWRGGTRDCFGRFYCIFQRNPARQLRSPGDHATQRQASVHLELDPPIWIDVVIDQRGGAALLRHQVLVVCAEVL